MSGYQDMYNSSSSSRSPGSHRHPPQQLRRQHSRQFDAYGPMSSTLYEEPQLGRYDTNPLDRLNATMPSNSYPYDISGAQTWNANGVSSHGLGGLGVNSATATSRMRNVRSRTALPTTWLDQQNSLPSSFSLAPGQHQQSPQIRAENSHDPEDELIPTAIVIKNIPFAVKKEQLIQLMTEMNLPLPYAFNYHFDNGVFRGLAFANFTSAEETATVIELLNHFELQGRKLRVEYKKMLPAQERERIEREKRERRGQLEEQHRPMASSQLQHQTSMSSLASHMPATSPSPVSQRAEVDMNDAQTLQYYSQLLLFKQDLSKEALIFGTNLTPAQRRIVHTISHNMGLAHTSRGTGEQRQVHVYRAGPGSNVSPPVPAIPSTVTSDAARRGLSRAATIDFGESRHEQQAYGSGMRQSSFLNVLDSPGPGGYANAQNLRAAKSFADLRSFTPSPVPSSASFPAALQTNGARFQQQQQQGYDVGTSGASNTPTLTPTPSGSSLGMQRVDDNLLVNSLGGLSLGTSVTGGPSGSPRRTRGIWDASDLPTSAAGSNNGSGSTAGAIGSNRSIGLGFDTQNQSQERLPMPMRQPRGPAPERGTGFRRQNGHQQRGSDELRSNPGVEIIVE